MSYSSEVLADSPRSYLKLDDTSGDPVNSGSGGALTSVTFTNVTQGVTGKFNKGISVSNGALVYRDGGNYKNDLAWSIEFWFKTTHSGSTSRLLWATLNNGADLDGLEFVSLSDGRIFLTYGGTATDGTSGSYNDGVWHHVVLTNPVGSGQFTWYIDNVSQGSTAKAATASTVNSIHLGGVGTAAFDMVAGYSTELADTRVAAHYAAVDVTVVNGGYTAQAMTASAAAPTAVVTTTTVINAGYTAQAMTASAAMPDPVVQLVHTSFTASAMTASALLPNAVGHAVTQILSITEDAQNSGGTPNGTTATDLVIGWNNGPTLLALPAPTVPGGEVVTGAILKLTATGTRGANTIDVYKVTSAWTEATLTSSNYPTMTYLKSVSVPSIVPGTKVSIDLSDVYSQISSNGIALVTPSSYYEVASSEHATVAYRPLITYGTSTIASAAFSATPMTADALMTTVGLSISDGYSAEVATATAAAVTPVVTVVKHLVVTATPMTATALIGDGGFAVPGGFDAATMVASATAGNAAVSSTRGVLFNAEAMTATSSLVKPYINGVAIGESEATDKYFTRVMASAPKYWARFNDLGTDVFDRINGQKIGVFHGVQMGQHNGPDGRHSVHFNGDASFQQIPDDSTSIVNPVTRVLESTVEFSFKTTKQNQFIMAGSDSFLGALALATVISSAKEVYLKDGKIGFRSYQFYGVPDTVAREFEGFRNLADGQWHSVQIRSGVKNTQGSGEIGVEIWVDGTFEVRRFSTGAENAAVPGFSGFPDYIGWRPSQWDAADLIPLPSSQLFEGDMSEVVYYNHINMQSHDIARHFYDFMGWSPFFAQPAEGFGFATNNSFAKGNQKKALYLYWDKEAETFDLVPDPTVADAIEFDPIRDFAKKAHTIDYLGFKVFRKGINFDDETLLPYRDPVTDDLSLINLETDVNLAEYDVIMFKDWPDQGPEIDQWNFYYPGQTERLLNQIRDAVDNGIGLYVTIPRLAADLGIIDRYEFVPTLAEGSQGFNQNTNLFDYGAAREFPWNIAEFDGIDPPTSDSVGGYSTGEPMNTNPAFLVNKAKYYADANANNRFRVRALVEGLTDIPSWQVDKIIHHWNIGTYAWNGAAYKYLHRESGLILGDEYIFNGALTGGLENDHSVQLYSRINGTFATPPGHVRAGTVVTTFGAKLWTGVQEVDNPYRDYATTIIVEPGDVLKGRSVGGRIFVNFSESPSEGLAVPVQMYDADNRPQGYPLETNAQREWEYSWTRTSVTVTGTELPFYVMEVGGVTIKIPLTPTRPGAPLSMTRSNSLFPVEGRARWEMDGRGMLWLAATPEAAAGSVTIRAEAATAVISVPQPQVVAHRDTVVGAQAMSASLKMSRPAEDPDKSAQVLPTAMTAYAELTGLSRTIFAGAMTATAGLVENFDMVHATGEQVVLTLHGTNAILYIREEV